MPMAKITRQGLAAIACAVALLWVCIVSERLMWRQAATEHVKVLREMEQLRRSRPAPVSVPVRSVPLHLQVLAG